MTLRAVSKIDLESAIDDAKNMADLTFYLIGSGLGFEKREPPKPTEHEATLVYFAASLTTRMADRVQEAFDQLP